jgi:hypothetical protein
MYLSLNNENIRKIEGRNKLNYRFLYFVDSDDKGVQTRLDTLRDLTNIDCLESHKLAEKDSYEVGCYIFHDTNHEDHHGQLEHIILTLMRAENEAIFQNGHDYIIKHGLDEARCKKFICNDVGENYKGSTQFKEDKSIISIAGQLQFSGASNAVVIANSDYITKAQLLNNPECINVAGLFEG